MCFKMGNSRKTCLQCLHCYRLQLHVDIGQSKTATLKGDAHIISWNGKKLGTPVGLQIQGRLEGTSVITRANTQEILLLKEQENILSVFNFRVMATGFTYHISRQKVLQYIQW